MAKRFFKALLSLGAILAGMHMANQYISNRALGDFPLNRAKGEYFNWRGLNIFYTKKGEGDPILLVHSTVPEASSREWRAVADILSQSRTVYAVDLPGCGNSAKPAEEYTCYYYSLLIEHFISEIIGSDSDVVTSRNASISGILAASSGKIKHLILIDPTSLSAVKESTFESNTLANKVLSLPIIGGFLFNSLMSYSNLKTKYSAFFRNTDSDAYREFINDCHQTSHINGLGGRHLLSDIMNSSLAFDFSYALKNLSTPICIVEGAYQNDLLAKIDAFKSINENVKATFVKESIAYPHVENPESTAKKLLSILDQ